MSRILPSDTVKYTLLSTVINNLYIMILVVPAALPLLIISMLLQSHLFSSAHVAHYLYTSCVINLRTILI